MVPVNQLSGMDWEKVFQSIPAGATARGLSLALIPIAGSAPEVINRGEYHEIIFTREQEERTAAWVITQLRREPGPVRMETGGIAWRVLTRQYWPYAAGLVAAGAVLAVAMGAGRRRGRK